MTETLPRHLRIGALTTALTALVALQEVAVVGAASPHLTFVEVYQDGVNGLDNAESMTVSPD